MNEEAKSTRPIVSGKWIALYVFASVWLLLVATLDASHFGPGFLPAIISIFLVYGGMILVVIMQQAS